jgi:hypothetical protein
MRALGGTAVCGLTAYVSIGLSGCLLITGSTDGYQLADTGTGGAMCAGDARCAGRLLGCSSAAACTTDGGVEVCCLVPASASGACSAQACAPAPFGAQLCETSAECAGGLECVTQQCMFGGAATTIQACGNILCSVQ